MGRRSRRGGRGEENRKVTWYRQCQVLRELSMGMRDEFKVYDVKVRDGKER